MVLERCSWERVAAALRLGLLEGEKWMTLLRKERLQTAAFCWSTNAYSRRASIADARSAFFLPSFYPRCVVHMTLERTTWRDVGGGPSTGRLTLLHTPFFRFKSITPRYLLTVHKESTPPVILLLQE